MKSGLFLKQGQMLQAGLVVEQVLFLVPFL